MSNTLEPYEIRDPVHGFIRLSELEWEVINQPVFQRLRRIRQLSWTDMVYPGATHTRFEHSIGVMHVASRMFDALQRRSGNVLKADYKFDDSSLGRQRRIIRLAALLHDLGHGPFSHAAEELMPRMKNGTTDRYEHEHYSREAIKHRLSDLIENHKEAMNNGIRVGDILDVFEESPPSAGVLVWKDLVSGQMDADRMDYLLRDAHHAGVQYGRYDLDRVIYSLRLCPDPETGDHHIGVEESGVHAVEGLLIARFMMFTQLYFHKTRVIYDYHLVECLKELLKSTRGVFQPPNKIEKFLEWDDWKVLGLISNKKGGDHGQILRDRRHYRMVFSTNELATTDEITKVDELRGTLEAYKCVVRDAEKSWYKSGSEEIWAWKTSDGDGRSVPLETLSPVVDGLIKVNQRRIYVPENYRSDAIAKVQQWAKN